MPLKTTCIGAYPKPDYVPITDWFQVGHDAEDYNEQVLRNWTAAPDIQAALDKATAEVIADQIACGIDVPTDGEVRRDHLTKKSMTHFDWLT